MSRQLTVTGMSYRVNRYSAAVLLHPRDMVFPVTNRDTHGLGRLGPFSSQSFYPKLDSSNYY
jgi:hypothetical protein